MTKEATYNLKSYSLRQLKPEISLHILDIMIEIEFRTDVYEKRDGLVSYS